MKVIIIEDEKPAAEKLLKAIQKTGASIEVVAVLNSVKASVDWLQQNPMPELLFMDIELGDGLSFKISAARSYSAPPLMNTGRRHLSTTALIIY
jgi:two-component system LytT family response regulator